MLKSFMSPIQETKSQYLRATDDYTSVLNPKSGLI